MKRGQKSLIYNQYDMNIMCIPTKTYKTKLFNQLSVNHLNSPL